MAAGDTDDLRVGNPERERAGALLNDALAQGYLDVHEFDERTAAVYAARTRGELRQVLAYLPTSDRLFPPAAVSSATPGAAASALVQIDWTTVARKGSWHVPGRLTITGSMGTADLDLSQALVAHPTLEIELQVSWSTVKLMLGHDHELQTGELVRTGWSSVKNKAGEPTGPTGVVVAVHGSLTTSTLVARRA